MALENLTTENFNDKVASSDIAIIDFWAPWCGPCKQFGPIFEKVAGNHPDILFGKVNTEEEQQIAQFFQIQSIPTVMIIREGIVLFQQPGMLPEEALEDLIRQVKELDMEQVRKEAEAQQQQQPSS